MHPCSRLFLFAPLSIQSSHRLAHTQRLQARTGVEKYDNRGLASRRCVDAAAVFGSLFAVLWFLAGSVPPMQKYDGMSAPQDRAHVAIAVLGYFTLVLYGLVTCFGVLAWGRAVFLLTDFDVFWFRWKLTCLAVLMSAAVVTAIAVPIQNRWWPDHADCNVAWCR